MNDANPAIAQYNLEENNLGIQGRDPVAYFQEGARKGVKGNKDLTSSYRGVTYRFASEANRSRFAAAPERFVPQFGGWCAWAMSQGKKVDVDPHAFVIDDHGLTLFYNDDKRDEWIAAGATMSKAADGEWRALHVSR